MCIRKIILPLVVAVACVSSVAGQSTATIKLATQAPLGSTWHKVLLDMGAEWEAKTAGRVKLTVYPGGIQGSEEATIKMMRPGVDQLQANLLMLPGLSSIDEAFSVFGLPFFFESDAEGQHVLEKLGPMLEKRLDAKGYKLLSWGSGGWIQLFSKKPIQTLAEVKGAKLFTSQGDDRAVQWYKSNGFNPVALTAGDIPAQLKLTTGMIDAAPMPPYPALLLQVFRDAKYMLDVHVAPLFGALVITNEAWNKLSAGDKQVVAASAKAAEKRLLGDASKLDADSIATMKSRGLVVNTPDAKTVAAFRAEAERLVPTMRDVLVPGDIYDMARRERDAFKKVITLTLRTLAVRAENALATLALAGIMLLPLAEIAMRAVLHRGIPGAAPFTLNLTLWVGLLGAAIAAREGKLLTLATGEFLPKGVVAAVAHVIGAFVGSAVAMMFAVGGLALVESERTTGTIIAVGVHTWVSALVFPVAFTVIAVRLAWRASPTWAGRAIAACGLVAGMLAARNYALFEGHALLPWLVALLVAGALGAPIFTLLGGIAMIAFFTDGSRPIVPLIKAYEELTSPSANLAAIPLFTLTGFFLAEGQSSTRLLRSLRALFGWVPGGTAIAAITLCAFFTLFTGGSGVTILALGGLLLPALIKEGYRERFAIGLLTASGSLGLLFPLSVPLILYAIVAQKAAVEDLFIGGILPGLFMLALLAALGVREAIVSKAVRTPFRASEAFGALWGAKWEMLLPIVVLWALLGGYATTSESAAIAALYAVIVQRFIHRDLPTMADVVRVSGDCVALVGGVLVILAVAVGLTNYLVNAQVPTLLIEWTQAHLHSKAALLLALNVFLLLVGTVMDIFSAIIVVVPLLLPLADAFGIGYVHLGVIFIANLELGYLHPPLGLNLLLASYRFKKPVLEVTWATLPMLGILAVGVLLITYVPWLTEGLLHMFGRL